MEFQPYLLKNATMKIAPSLFYIFQKSLEQGTVPESFKKASYSQRWQSKGAQEFQTSSPDFPPCKGTGKTGSQRVGEIPPAVRQLNPEQHGFCSGRSTTSQLVQHMENIVERLEEGYALNVIYLDFAKAFDKVDHGILLRTLQSLGVRGPLGKWIYSFLTGRSQVVKVNGEESDPIFCNLRVPQGTALAVTLFICMNENNQ